MGQSQPAAKTADSILGKDFLAALVSGLTIVGLATYVLLRLAYSVFYSQLGITPEDVGLGYGVVLSQSVTGLAFLVVLFGIITLVVVGLAGITFVVGLATSVIVGVVRSRIPAKETTRRSDKLNALRTVLSFSSAFLGLIGAVIPVLFSVLRLNLSGITSLLVAPIDALLHSVQGLSAVYAQIPWPLWLLAPVTGLPLFGIVLDRLIPPRNVRTISPSVEKIIIWTTVVLVALSTIGTFQLIAASDGQAVSQGKARHASVLGVRIAGWSADPATIIWPSTATSGQTPSTIAAQPPAFTYDCLMFLGQTSATTYLYDANTHDIIHIPLGSVTVLVHDRKETC